MSDTVSDITTSIRTRKARKTTKAYSNYSQPIQQIIKYKKLGKFSSKTVGHPPPPPQDSLHGSSNDHPHVEST